MTSREIILAGIEYIEKNLQNDISVIDISKKTGYSLFHFIRLFQSITGFSPKSYILQRRLSEAARELMDTDKKIIEIAYDYQFGSPEAFSRAFRKQFKMKPLEVKKNNSLTSFPLIFPITVESIVQTNKIRGVPPEIVELPEILVVGMSIFVGEQDDGHIISELWGKFLKEVDQIKNRVIPERYYQIQYWSENQELNGLFFNFGVEVTESSEIPPLFVLKTIPKSTYLRFIHKGLSNMVGYTYKYIYNQFLPNTEYKLSLPYNFEFYGKNYKGPDDENSESEIYIPIELT